MPILVAGLVAPSLASCAQPPGTSTHAVRVWAEDGDSNLAAGFWVAMSGPDAPAPDVSLVTWPELEPVGSTARVVTNEYGGRWVVLDAIEPPEARWYAVLVDVRELGPSRYEVNGVSVLEPGLIAYRVFGTSAPRIVSISGLDREPPSTTASQVTILFSERVVVPEGVAIPVAVSTPEGPCSWFGQGLEWGPVSELYFGCDVDHVESVRVEVLERLVAESGDGALLPQIIENAETYRDPPPDR